MRNALIACGAAALAIALTAQPVAQSPPPDDALMKRARAIHERVITLDTHDDINVRDFTPERNYTQRLDTQVNLPKMVEGGLDVAFFIVYVGQGPLTADGYDNAYRQAIAKFDAIHRLTTEIAPDKIELALSADDVRRIAKSGKKVAVIGIENGYPIGEDITRVQEFYERGGRYLSLAHNGHSQLADSNSGERDGQWLHKGLSSLGRQVIAEANRLGIMVDISHPSKEANLQAIALSKAPVIASHSGARALADHSRNLDDELLLALKKNGGVAQAVALGGYVKITEPSPERTAALAKLEQEFELPAGSLQGRGGRGRGAGGRGQAAGTPPGGAPPATGAAAATAGGGTQQAGAGGGTGRGGRGRGNPLAQLPEEKRVEAERRLADINEKFPPPPRPTVKDFVDHIDYIVKKIGIDHVGISSDFDGGGGIEGWNDASETFNVTLELVRRGYTEEQIAKIWSGNLLRVMAEVERIAREQRRS